MLWNPGHHPAFSSLPHPVTAATLPYREGLGMAVARAGVMTLHLLLGSSHLHPGPVAPQQPLLHLTQYSGTQHALAVMYWSGSPWGEDMPGSTSPPWPRQGLSVWWLAGSRTQLWSGPDMLSLGCELSLWWLWGSALAPWVFKLALGDTVFLHVS